MSTDTQRTRTGTVKGYRLALLRAADRTRADDTPIAIRTSRGGAGMLISEEQMTKLEAIVDELDRREYERILRVMLVKSGVLSDGSSGPTLDRIAAYLQSISVDQLDERPELRKAFKESVTAIQAIRDLQGADAGDQGLAKVIATLNRALKFLNKNGQGKVG